MMSAATQLITGPVDHGELAKAFKEASTSTKRKLIANLARLIVESPI